MDPKPDLGVLNTSKAWDHRARGVQQRLELSARVKHKGCGVAA